MWLSKREWLVVLLCTMLIIPGVAYYFFNPHYVNNIIDDTGSSDTMRVTSDSNERKKLIINLAGISTANYALKLNLFYRANDSRSAADVRTEMIEIPAGTFNGSFTRDLPAQLNTESAEIIYIPGTKSALGTVRIEAGIF